MKYKWYGQILSVIFAHIKAALIFFIVWAIAIGLTGTRVGGLIYSSISAVFYAIIIYSEGYAAEKNDKKSYTPLEPFAYKGAIIATGLLFMNILVLVTYKLSWTFGSDGGTLVKLWALLGNFFSIFWFSPYLNLLGMESGKFSGFGYAIVLVLHMLMSSLGYYAGYKNFDLSEKMQKFIYEKK